MSITGVLITGGGGFLGSHLAEYFLEKNIPVLCVDNFCTGYRSNVVYLTEITKNKKNFQFIEADVIESWRFWTSNIEPEIQSKISHVFHFASPASPPHYQRMSLETMWVNSLGLKNAIEYADKIRARVIFASTSEVYGEPQISPQPESYWGNVNPQGHRSCYDEAKRFGEALLFSSNIRNKSQHGLVRIFNTYGPRMNPNDGRVVINFLVQAIKGQPLTILGDGTQTRSFCFVSDLIRGVCEYAATNLTEPVNIGNDIEFSVKELAEVVQEIFQEQKLKYNFYPLPSDDPKQRKPDLNKAKKLLNGWSPKISLKEGLLQTVGWLRKVDMKTVELPGRPL